MVKNSSDQLPILFKFYGLKENVVPRSRPLRFENIWLSYDSCTDIVQYNWNIKFLMTWLA